VGIFSDGACQWIDGIGGTCREEQERYSPCRSRWARH